MLVSYEAAAIHLKLYELKTDPEITADLTRKLIQAEALVLAHLKTHLWDPPPTWDENTDPADDPQFAITQSAILMATANLWRFRGDDENPSTAGNPLAGNGAIDARVIGILASLRDPSFA